MPILRYTMLRLLVLLATLALLWLVGLRGPWLLLVGLLVSGVLSIFVLNRTRDQVSEAVVARIDRRRNTPSRAETEDAWDEARRNEAPGDDGRG